MGQMHQKPIHIISFDNPFPPVYGGAIDVFYKIKALYGLGFRIYLHCFVDQLATDNATLGQYVEKVFFYERKKKGIKLFSKAPFSVASRYNELLVKHISDIDAPILFEGLQSTYLLSKHEFGDRKIFLRLMNLESNYFEGLYRSEKDLFKKALFRIEAFKYERYQKIIAKFNAVFTLSVYETEYVAKHFGNAHYIPVFHGNEKVATLSGFGKYALYHGDLRMADNKRAALFLIDVFKKIPDYNLVIASNHGKKIIRKEIKNVPNVSYIDIKNQQHLDELLSESHMSVMLSFQQSGTKLKSVNALYKSRFCIINKNMVDDEKIRSLCTLAETESEFIAAINKLKTLPYEDYERRKKVLDEVLDDHANAQSISRIINQS